ncbi:putative Ig domain-containing protein [Amnibacterium sp.]|uniref:putative Ig domain-containing protein n=1 Tax=Amnibacterium sp. TaxID=1872496 RepID=UPI003F7C311F
MSAPSSIHRRRLLIGGMVLPAALTGSLLVATSASAAGTTVTTKAALVAAFQSASNGTVITLGADLTGDGGASDVVTTPAARSFRLDLNGHRLEVDLLVVSSTSALVVLDSSAQGAQLSVGGASVNGSESGGVQTKAGSRLEIQSAVTLDASGSTGRAGIGPISPSDTDVVLAIDDGATVEATGGFHGAGIGGGEGAVPLSTISIGHASVTATGGTGAAAIGGGYGSTGTPSAISIENGDVTLAGDTAATFSSLDNLATGGGSSTLRVASNSTLTVPAGATLRNSGRLEVGGTLTGAGTIDNTGGTIRRDSGGSIDDAALTITGRNHPVSFATGAGSTTAPAVQHVYATTFADAGLDLSAYTGTSGGKSLVGWSGSGITHVTNDDLLAALSTSGGEGDPVTLTAAYETPIAFTGSALPNAATDRSYAQQAPVTGDATAFSVTSNTPTGLPADTIPAFPSGLAIDGSTGAITGRPATSGHYSFVLTASSPHQQRSQVVTVDVAGAPVVATTSLPDATTGIAYRAPVLATSERGAIAYAITGNALPSGLSLDSATGVIAGTPTAVGDFGFTVAATNDFGTTERTLTLTVAAAAVVPPADGGSTTPGTGGSSTGGSGSGGSGSVGGNTGSGGTGTSGATGGTGPSTPVTAVPSAPVLPVLGTTMVRLGHPLSLSVAASSTVPVTYSARAKDLPAGLTLDRSKGLLQGAPRTSGRFTLHLTATSNAGHATRSYTILVPAITHLVTGSASAVTPRTGTSVRVTVHGLKAGERFRIALNGRQVATGRSTFGGSLTRTVRLPARAKDTVHRIRVTGSRRVTDPATTASHELTVTAVSSAKRLRVTRSGSTLTVRGLAAKERVTIRRGRTVLATGRADAHGVFVKRTSRLQHGTHTVTGSTAKRTGRLVVR